MYPFFFGIKQIALLRQECHNSKSVIFQEKLLKVLKCCNFLWVQRRHNCYPAASFSNCFVTLYLLKVHLQTFPSIPITQKCQILSCDTLVANERNVVPLRAINVCGEWSVTPCIHNMGARCRWIVASRCGRLFYSKNHQRPQNKLDGPHSQYGRFAELHFSPGNRTSAPRLCSPYTFTIFTELSRLLSPSVASRINMP